MEPLLLGRKEAAAALGICLRMLDYMIAHGELAVRRVGRRVLIERRELERFARGIHVTSVVKESHAKDQDSH